MSERPEIHFSFDTRHKAKKKYRRANKKRSLCLYDSRQIVKELCIVIFFNLQQDKFRNGSITMSERPGINFSFDTSHKAKKNIGDQPKYSTWRIRLNLQVQQESQAHALEPPPQWPQQTTRSAVCSSTSPYRKLNNHSEHTEEP